MDIAVTYTPFYVGVSSRFEVIDCLKPVMYYEITTSGARARWTQHTVLLYPGDDQGRALQVIQANARRSVNFCMEVWKIGILHHERMRLPRVTSAGVFPISENRSAHEKVADTSRVHSGLFGHSDHAADVRFHVIRRTRRIRRTHRGRSPRRRVSTRHVRRRACPSC